MYFAPSYFGGHYFAATVFGGEGAVEPVDPGPGGEPGDGPGTYYGTGYFGSLYFSGPFFGHAGNPVPLSEDPAYEYVPGDDDLAGGLGSYAYVGGGSQPEPAADLLEAIWSVAAADADLEEAFGRAGWLWVGKGARGVPLPYAVVFEVGTVEFLTTGPSYHENLSIQFNVFASSEGEAKRLGLMINDLYAPREGQTAVEFLGGTDLDRWPGDGNVLEREVAKGSGGVAVFVQRINYTWRVGRSYEPDA